MSETLTSLEFDAAVSPVKAMEVVALEGAVAIHNFLPPMHLWRAARVLEREPWQTDSNNRDGEVHRRHDLIQYGFSADHPWPVATAGTPYAPEPIFTTARRISDFVSKAPNVNWKPNEIMGHRYNPGDFIDKHRDYARALGFVAVLTLEGSQEFFFERDAAGEEARIEMNPGTLTIMRGFQAGEAKPRPLHWVGPAPDRRLAISLRQMRMDW